MEAKMHFARLLKLTVLAVAAMVLAAPALAQNNKPIRSVDFYEDRASALANGQLGLALTFAQSPTDKFLNITNVACDIGVASTQSINTVTLFVGTASGQNDLGRTYPIKGNTTPELVASTKQYSIVTNQVFYKMGPGRFPSIAMGGASTGSASITANCVIVGNLTDN
jgi:hypothetical protein